MRSRAVLAPFSGVGSGAMGPKPSRTVAAEGPCRAQPKPHPTPSLHRARAALPPHLRPRPKPRTAARAATSRGSRARGRMTPKRHPTRAIARLAPASAEPRLVSVAGDGALSLVRPCGRPGSGRYPNPIHSDTSRRETAGPPGGDSGRPHPRLGKPGRRRHAPVRERCLHDPTSRAPTPAKGRSSRAHDEPLARGRRQCLPRHVSRRAWRAAAHGVSLARTHREPRAASPALPRRRTRFAEPEVPSIGEPATPASTRPKPRVSEATGSVYRQSGRRRPPGDRGFPQVVTNLWKMVDAFCNLNGSAAL